MGVSKLDQVHQHCRAQIKVLEQALKFSQDIERQLRDRIEHLEGCIENWDKLYTALETKLKHYSAHYPEGFRWDIDDYPARQTRRWNPETRELEPGQDPPFVAPPAVPFEKSAKFDCGGFGCGSQPCTCAFDTEGKSL
jgi:hypothetical protein